jgi:hypothetical protein
MDRIELLTPILEGGIRNTYFFNGRLLTAEDLRVEQEANRNQRQQLGQAIGEGIIYGLQVQETPGILPSSETPSSLVRVSAGLALNRLGQALLLPTDLDVALVHEEETVDAEAGLFVECEPPEPTAIPTGTGVYILVLSPASGFEGRAPVSGLGGNGATSAGCGSQYAVEGVRFRLIRLDVKGISGISDTTHNQLDQLMLQSDVASLSKLRNLLAHLCFGTEILLTQFPDPFAPPETYGALDHLRAQGHLTDCDVPLVLLYWTTAGIQFTDMWSVRRRLVQPLVGDPWPLHVGQRRLAEAEAMFLQFQNQIEDTRLRETNLSSITAIGRFRYLPSAGYLPLGTGEFNSDQFFSTLDVERVPVDVAALRWLVHQSWFLEPIDLLDPPPIRIYEAPENPDYLLFLRDERQVEAPVTPEPPPPPEPGTTPKTGRMNIDVIQSDSKGELPLTTEKSSKGTNLDTGEFFLTSGKSPTVDKDIQIWAEDELGNKYVAKFVPSDRGVKFGQSKEVVFVNGKARFKIDTLPPGTYTVRLKMKGFKDASQLKKVNAGQTTSVVFKLVPETKKPGGKVDRPPDRTDGKWIFEWYEDLVIPEKYFKWPWPPEEWEFRDPIINPPLEVYEDLKDWGDWFKIQHPDAPIDPGNIKVYMDPTHTPDVITEDPYAYAVFGEGGGYVPIILIPTDQAFGRSVPVSKGGLAGVDRYAEDQLKSSGLNDLDVLGASWTGFVADTLGVSAEAAGTMITESRGKIDDLKKPENSLLLFTGVDTDVQNALKGIGINNSVDLANADPIAIANQLGESGITLSFAQRLVDEARQTVPGSAWSLDAAELGFKEQEVAALEAQGIKTQGMFKNTAEIEQGKEQIANTLRVGTNVVDGFVMTINDSANKVKDAYRIEAPVTSVVGVNAETGKNLANLGYGTTGKLANADAAAVAPAFGGDMDKASAAINAAKFKTGL